MAAGNGYAFVTTPGKANGRKAPRLALPRALMNKLPTKPSKIVSYLHGYL
jgi:hypothetical protein